MCYWPTITLAHILFSLSPFILCVEQPPPPLKLEALLSGNCVSFLVSPASALSVAELHFSGPNPS